MSASTINVVKYYFHARHVPKTQGRITQYIRLAYQTARDKELYPKAVFIRSEVHDTTIINGKPVKDPLGDHVTFSYKTQDQLGRETHVACHGYVKDKITLEFREATHAPEKPDSTKKKSGKDVWPNGDDELWEAARGKRIRRISSTRIGGSTIVRRPWVLPRRQIHIRRCFYGLGGGPWRSTFRSDNANLGATGLCTHISGYGTSRPSPRWLEKSGNSRQATPHCKWEP
ncbi:hypothetical protein V8F20_001411 [Naviculisporaceae sp. PSN 640]